MWCVAFGESVNRLGEVTFFVFPNEIESISSLVSKTVPSGAEGSISFRIVNRARSAIMMEGA